MLLRTVPCVTTTTTKSYTYGNDQWKDLLTAVNGSPILYEGQENGGPVESGNPILYTNGTKTYTDLTWQHGRQLTSITTGNKTYTYDYDADGIRTEKVVNGVTHTYLTLNGKVVRESFPYGSSSVVMHFIYDESGRPFGLLYSTNGGSSFSQYYYAVNAQGDVEGIFFIRKNTTSSKQEVQWMGHYTYDAWGNPISITDDNGNPITTPNTLLTRNPLRYRGYYYDTETGFYYLQSRYYDPANHRFINADCYTSTEQGFLGYNMFAYCNNNVVNLVDPMGDDPWWLLPDWGFIHRKVQEKIKEDALEQGRILQSEKKITLPDGLTGRADLYDPATDEIWEVKSSGPASLFATAQLEMYLTGTITETTKSPIIGKERFAGRFDCGRFSVVYWSSEPGVILYKFWDNENKIGEVYSLIFAGTVCALVFYGMRKISRETVFGLEQAQK